MYYFLNSVVRERVIAVWTLYTLKIFYRYHSTLPNIYCQSIAQGTLLNVMRQTGWEGSLGENGCM